jgi:hypothetical protein
MNRTMLDNITYITENKTRHVLYRKTLGVEHNNTRRAIHIFGENSHTDIIHTALILKINTLTRCKIRITINLI